MSSAYAELGMSIFETEIQISVLTRYPPSQSPAAWRDETSRATQMPLSYAGALARQSVNRALAFSHVLLMVSARTHDHASFSMTPL